VNAHPLIGQRQPRPVHQFGVVDDAFGIEHVEVLIEEASQRNPLGTLRSTPDVRQDIGIKTQLPRPRQRSPHFTSEPPSAQRGHQLCRPLADTPAGQQLPDAELLFRRPK